MSITERTTTIFHLIRYLKEDSDLWFIMHMRHFVGLCAMICGLLLPGIIAGQCGNDMARVPADYHKFYRSEAVQQRSPVVSQVGVAVHIVDPENVLLPEMAEIQAAIDLTNTYYEDAGINFFICDVNVISGSRIYNLAGMVALNKSQYIDHRVNVYLISKLTGFNSQFLCGQAVFPWDAEYYDRFCVLSFDCLSDQHTLPHELGHYYGLLHTHNQADGVEYVDGSNCWDAGDRLCDTPADPGLGFHNVAQCQYSGSAMDPQGDSYSPDATLIMSYTPGICAQNFTSLQEWVINTYAEDVNNDLINTCDDLPDFSLSSTLSKMTATFASPPPIPLVIGGEFAGEQTLDITYWISDNPEERGDLIKSKQVQLTPGSQLNYNLDFVVPPGRSDGLHYLTIKLDADRQFAELDEWNNEVEIELTLVNSNLDDAALFPNPVTDYVSVLRRSEGVPGIVDISVYDLSGRLMRKFNFESGFEQFYVQLDLTDLETGVYQLAATSSNTSIGFDKTWLIVKL